MDNHLAPQCDFEPTGELGNPLTPEEAPRNLSPRGKIIATAALLVISLICIFPLGDFFSDPATYADMIETIDEKKATVMGLVAGSTATAGAISLFPGDIGTPIAEGLVDLSADFLIVLAALYLEKYLLTIFGFAAMKVIIPVSCALFCGALWLYGRRAVWQALCRTGIRFVMLGALIMVIVPSSVMVSDMIDRSFSASIEETLTSADETTKELEKEAEENGDWLGGLVDTVTSGVTNLTADAQRALNNFIESFAVMIVTSCLIPILVLLFYLWVIRTLLGIRIEIPRAALHRTVRSGHRKAAGAIKRG